MNNSEIFIFFFSILLNAGFLFVIHYLYSRHKQMQHEVMQHEDERLAVFQMLNTLGKSIGGDIDEEKSLRIISQYLTDLTNSSAGAIFVLNEDKETLSARVIVGMFPPLHKTIDYVLTRTKYLERAVKQDKIPLGQSVVGIVAETGEPILIENGLNDPRIPKQAHELVEVDNMIVAPIKIHGNIFGVICMINKRNDREYTKADLSMLEATGSQAAVLIDIVRLYNEMSQKHRVDKELEVAYKFQNMMLPKEVPEAPGISFTGFNKPALEIGGDFYDFIWLDEHRLALVVADVVGKGIPGALIMSMACSIIRAQSNYIKSPMEIMLEVNRRFLRDTEDKVFITMIYGIIDFRECKMTFCRAGQDPILTHSAETGEISVHSPPGIALGLMDGIVEKVMKEMEIPLKDGDLNILYTDGIVEAMNEKSEEYGQERLKKMLTKHAKSTPTQLQEAVLQDVAEFAGKAPQHDDLTMIIFRVEDTEKMKNFGSTKIINVQGA